MLLTYSNLILQYDFLVSQQLKTPNPSQKLHPQIPTPPPRSTDPRDRTTNLWNHPFLPFHIPQERQAPNNHQQSSTQCRNKPKSAGEESGAAVSVWRRKKISSRLRNTVPETVTRFPYEASRLSQWGSTSLPKWAEVSKSSRRKADGAEKSLLPSARMRGHHGYGERRVPR